MDDHPQYAFESFIAIRNEEALATCLAFAARRGNVPNPLVLHGPTAGGKTHLLYAIAQRMRSAEAMVRQTTFDRYLHELVEAIRIDTLSAFRASFADVAALLVDDLPVPPEFPHAREELLRQIQQLIARGVAVVLTTPVADEDLRQRLPSAAFVEVRSPCLILPPSNTYLEERP